MTDNLDSDGTFTEDDRGNWTQVADPAHIDEMERRGDSLLDEESFLLSGVPLAQVEGMVGDRLQLGFPGIGAVRLTPDDARNFANAILSELEIAQREGDGEW